MGRVLFTSTSASFFAEYCARISGQKYLMTRDAYRESRRPGWGFGKDDTLVVLGLYRSAGPPAVVYPRLAEWFGRAIVVPTGSDLVQLRQVPEVRAELLRQLRDLGVTFALESDDVHGRVSDLEGIEWKRFYLPSGHEFDADLAPLPQQFAVSCYLPPKELYRPKLVFEVADRMPEVPFYFYSAAGTDHVPSAPNRTLLPWIPMEGAHMQDHLRRVSCAVRVPEHDTYSMSVIEASMAGRWSVVSYDMPHTCRVSSDPTADEIVACLREVERRGTLNVDGAKLYRSRHSSEVFRDKVERILKGEWDGD